MKSGIETIREKIKEWSCSPYLYRTFNKDESPYSPYPSWMSHNTRLEIIRDFYERCKEYESFKFSIEPVIVGKAKLYSYSELQMITDFKPDRLILYTLSGRLFHGTIGEGSKQRQVIVKTWDLLLPETNQHYERPIKFCDEVELFTNEKANTHSNLAKLHGYCYDTRLAAVYDEEFTGVLADVILADNFDWDNRVFVATQLADLLAWLHDKGIAFGSITDSCILVNKEAKIKVFDFGYISNNVNMNSTIPVRADVGWDAPEVSAGKRSMKSDVYVFGLLLLVLISKKEFDFDGGPLSVKKSILNVTESGKKSLVNECFEVGHENASKVTELVKQCTNLAPEKRPTMKNVLECLNSLRGVKRKEMFEFTQGSETKKR